MLPFVKIFDESQPNRCTYTLFFRKYGLHKPNVKIYGIN